MMKVRLALNRLTGKKSSPLRGATYRPHRPHVHSGSGPNGRRMRVAWEAVLLRRSGYDAGELVSAVLELAT